MKRSKQEMTLMLFRVEDHRRYVGVSKVVLLNIVCKRHENDCKCSQTQNKYHLWWSSNKKSFDVTKLHLKIDITKYTNAFFN